MHKKGQGGELSQKGSKDTILTSYQWKDLRDDHWECIFAILELTKGITVRNRIICLPSWSTTSSNKPLMEMRLFK